MQVIRPTGMPPAALTAATARLRSARKAVALTGAGVSVASGIPDFRSVGGLWTVFSPDEYATLEVFHRNPAKAWELYRALGRTLLGRSPNSAHRALAEMEHQGLIQGIITQNVDNLHERAGSSQVLHLHGELTKLRSTRDPGYVIDWHHDQLPDHADPMGAPMRPHIVWFGEEVPALEQALELVAEADVVLVVGTSLKVYPAAGLIAYAPPHADGYLIDPNPSLQAAAAYDLTVIPERAALGVPKVVDYLLRSD